MNQSESIRIIQTALRNLVASGLLERIPSSELGAIALEIGPMRTKCVWHPLEWWQDYVDNRNHQLFDLALNLVSIIQKSDPKNDLIVAGRIDSPSEQWEILTIERPLKS